MKNFTKIISVVAVIVTIVSIACTNIASFWVWYQPETPECLK